MLRFPHQNEVRFVLTSNYLQVYSCLIYVICVCLRIVVSNTYYVVFLFCLSSYCCQFLRIANFWLTLRYSLAYIYIKYKSTYETQHAWYTSLEVARLRRSLVDPLVQENEHLLPSSNVWLTLVNVLHPCTTKFSRLYCVE